MLILYTLYRKKDNMGLSCKTNCLNYNDTFVYIKKDEDYQGSDEDSDGAMHC